MAALDNLDKYIESQKYKPSITRPVQQTQPANINADLYGRAAADMRADPAKYYLALGNSVTRYKQELGFADYMSRVNSYGLPEEYTKFGNILGDMKLNPAKYKEQFGWNDKKLSAVTRDIGELFGMEQDNALFLMDTIDKGTKIADFGLDDESAYLLSTMYQYDMTDEKDMLNAQLGLMPKAFSYGNSFEEQQRELAGELPIEAQTYIANSKRFQEEYAEYNAAMQQYANELWLEENDKNWKRNNPKPKDPYPNRGKEGGTGLASVDAMFEDYDKQRQAEAMGTDFFDSGREKNDAPHMFVPEELPLVLGDFEVEDVTREHTQYVAEQMEGGAKFEEASLAFMRTLPEFQEYERQQAQLDSEVTAALEQGYTPENYKFVTDNVNWVTEVGEPEGLF